MNSVYGHNRISPTFDILYVGYDVDLITRKITFEYHLSSDIGFNFSLLSECRDDVQVILGDMMLEDKISLGILDTESEYCNVVVSGNLPWEEEE